MSNKIDRAIRELEAVEMMTNRFKVFLASQKCGGDWTLQKFMDHLNDTVRKSREVLEVANNA